MNLFTWLMGRDKNEIGMSTSKLELLPDWGESPPDTKLESSLQELKKKDGVFHVDYKNGALLVETNLPSSVMVDLVENITGHRVVLQGFGDAQSAVAMVTGVKAMGVIRFTQTEAGALVVDGTVDGLSPGEHGLHVHEAGDLSEGCESIGGHYNPLGSKHGAPEAKPEARHAGDLGNISADETGRAAFRITDSVLKVWDIIGRSVSISAGKDDLGQGGTQNSTIDGNSGPSVACGIIARSAGIFQNPKRICLCDGVTVWDERSKPLAGEGRTNGGCCKKDKENKRCCGNL